MVGEGDRRPGAGHGEIGTQISHRSGDTTMVDPVKLVIVLS